MAAASVILGLLAFLFMVGGLFTAMVPVMGSVLSFGAPVLGLFGMVFGGVAMSRANQMGDSNGLAITGLVVSAISFFLGLLFALTCGMCNACVTAAAMNPQPNGGAWSPGGPTGPAFGGPTTGTTGPSGPSPAGWGGPTPTGGTAPPLPVGAVPGDDVCERAERCCLAFADGDADFCGGAVGAARRGDAPEEACRTLLDGYVQGFETTDREVAEVCRAPSAAAGGPPVCTDHCVHARDGECDDGRPGSQTDLCVPGSDCADCGPLQGASWSAGGRCDESCPSSGDGECDDGRPGAHTDLCAPGTDCADCGA
ncbi:MAG TPA: hypothetical protein RMH85_23135 [Polyangiaceae bacterium LLY-WYZ-15_(1-7)]|nr:hypothetical protein [Myxococcales bacterium]MAT26825.1 hypothetical protein [Sandaracinus sp.]HJK93787.1 hypothetical protein [Polyangiaceae bacterium LLY-WYZ-15_(1-7)]MBJ73324.1 hypothetical protein [Sandaracinus sp.]HJK99863.1 hypothetical protein [Polyangiaceae bacterium LLY-WYZ-15_(1-7)]